MGEQCHWGGPGVPHRDLRRGRSTPRALPRAQPMGRPLDQCQRAAARPGRPSAVLRPFRRRRRALHRRHGPPIFSPRMIRSTACGSTRTTTPSGNQRRDRPLDADRHHHGQRPREHPGEPGQNATDCSAHADQHRCRHVSRVGRHQPIPYLTGPAVDVSTLTGTGTATSDPLSCPSPNPRS